MRKDERLAAGRRLSRRHYLGATLAVAAGPLIQGIPRAGAATAPAPVYMMATDDPQAAMAAFLARLPSGHFAGRSVAIKANYNSDDPFPASTAPDTLEALLVGLQGAGAQHLTLAERSGMGDTRAVLRATGVSALAERLGVSVEIIEDLPADGFVAVRPEASSWRRGFKLARSFAGSDIVVQTCCLKTHRFGGHFTMSLKNAVGAVAKRDPADGYDYMNELHGSPNQRLMIAEISLAFKNDLILMDARKAFVSGGPERGELAAPGLFLAAQDPVAIDAVGVAILRHLGTTPEVTRGPIFDQEQIAHATALGVGVRGPDEIVLVPLDQPSEEWARSLAPQLA